jgi:hypothetical protein
MTAVVRPSDVEHVRLTGRCAQVRIIFRLCEFGPGVNINNPILRDENYQFVLDGFPMLLALVLLNVVHPGTVLRGPESDFPRLSRKEKKAIRREKKEQKMLARQRKKGEDV